MRVQRPAVLSQECSTPQGQQWAQDLTTVKRPQQAHVEQLAFSNANASVHYGLFSSFLTHYYLAEHFLLCLIAHGFGPQVCSPNAP